MVDQIEALLGRAETDETVRVVVVAGVGDTFCAGADWLPFPLWRATRCEPGSGNAWVAPGRYSGRSRRFPSPSSPPWPAWPAPGRLGAHACCDLVVAGRRALFGDAHSTHGQLPGGGASVRLPRRVGATRAKHLLFTGDLVPAQTFLEWGLVNEVVDDDQLVEATDRLASLLAEKSPRACGA